MTVSTTTQRLVRDEGEDDFKSCRERERDKIQLLRSNYMTVSIYNNLVFKFSAGSRRGRLQILQRERDRIFNCYVQMK